MFSGGGAGQDGKVRSVVHALRSQSTRVKTLACLAQGSFSTVNTAFALRCVARHDAALATEAAAAQQQHSYTSSAVRAAEPWPCSTVLACRAQNRRRLRDMPPQQVVA